MARWLTSAWSALGDSMLLNALLFALMLAVGIWYVWSPRTRISDVAVTLMGPIYTGFMLSAIVLLRDAVPGFAGALLSVGVCASLWVSDSFAYIVGSRIGKHKMVPKISPKKSWEGFAGGILGSVLIWLILWATHFYKLSLPYALLCGVVVSILGVIGDLIESRIKRVMSFRRRMAPMDAFALPSWVVRALSAPRRSMCAASMPIACR